MLFFAGCGLVVENLWCSRQCLSTSEWAQIWVLLIFIITENIIGLVLMCADFIYKYACMSQTSCNLMRGGKMLIENSVVRRDDIVTGSLHEIADSWPVVAHLEGFMFFAYAQSLARGIEDILNHQPDEPYRKLPVVVMDCEALVGMDASATKGLRKSVISAKEMGIKVIFCALRPGNESHVRKGGLFNDQTTQLLHEKK